MDFINELELELEIVIDLMVAVRMAVLESLIVTYG